MHFAKIITHRELKLLLDYFKILATLNFNMLLQTEDYEVTTTTITTKTAPN